MTPVESFPHLLNEIFSDFNIAASVQINYTVVTNENAVNDKPDVRLISVNGFRSLTTYVNCISSLKANLLCKLIEIVKGLETSTKQIFIQHAIIRGRKFLKIIAYLNHPSEADPVNSQLRNYYGFHNPRFANALDHYPDEATKQLLSFLTHRYAWMWKLTIEELIGELQSFLYLVEFLPALTPPVPLPVSHEKIPIRSSVAALAATARLFFDHQAIALDNKSQFCRLVADMFSTTRQKEISARSLKNHFDSPTPETIGFLVEEFRKMMNNSRDLCQAD